MSFDAATTSRRMDLPISEYLSVIRRLYRGEHGEQHGAFPAEAETTGPNEDPICAFQGPLELEYMTPVVQQLAMVDYLREKGPTSKQRARTVRAQRRGLRDSIIRRAKWFSKWVHDDFDGFMTWTKEGGECVSKEDLIEMSPGSKSNLPHVTKNLVNLSILEEENIPPFGQRDARRKARHKTGQFESRGQYVMYGGQKLRADGTH